MREKEGVKLTDEVAKDLFWEVLSEPGDDLFAAPIGSELTSHHRSENKTRDLTSKHMRKHVPRSSGPPRAGTVCLLLLCSCGTDSGPGLPEGMSPVRNIRDADQAAPSMANIALYPDGVHSLSFRA
jgi:hypothetical protein